MNLNKANKGYVIQNKNQGFNIEFLTALPTAKRAKKLTLTTSNKKLVLNGHQINLLKKVFAKENLINKEPNTTY